MLADTAAASAAAVRLLSVCCLSVCLLSGCGLQLACQRRLSCQLQRMREAVI